MLGIANKCEKLKYSDNIIEDIVTNYEDVITSLDIKVLKLKAILYIGISGLVNRGCRLRFRSN